MREPVDRPPLARNHLAEQIFILIGVIVKLPAELRRLRVAENPDRIQITILGIKLLFFRAELACDLPMAVILSVLQERMQQPRQLIRFRQKSVVTVGGDKFPMFAADTGLLHA